MASIARYVVTTFLSCQGKHLPAELTDGRYTVNSCYKADTTVRANSIRLNGLELNALDEDCLVDSLVLLCHTDQPEHSIVGVVTRLPGGSHTVVTIERARWPTDVGEHTEHHQGTESSAVPESLGSHSDRIVTYRPRRSSWKPSHLPSLVKYSPSIPFPTTPTTTGSLARGPEDPEISATSLNQHIWVYSIDFESNPPSFTKFCDIAKHVSKSLPPNPNSDEFSARDSVLFAAMICMVMKTDCRGSEPRFNPKLKPITPPRSRSVSPPAEGHNDTRNIPYRIYTTGGKKGTLRVLDHDNPTFKASVGEISRNLYAVRDILPLVEDNQDSPKVDSSGPPSEGHRSDLEAGEEGRDSDQDSLTAYDVENTVEADNRHQAQVSPEERAIPARLREEVPEAPEFDDFLDEEEEEEVLAPPQGDLGERLVPSRSETSLFEPQFVTSPEVEWARAQAQQARQEAYQVRSEAREVVRKAMLEAEQARAQAMAEAHGARAEAEQGRMEARRARAEGRYSFANGRDTWANGREAWAQGRLAWANGRQSWANGRRAWAEGQEMRANEREASAAQQEAWADLEEARLRNQNTQRLSDARNYIVK